MTQAVANLLTEMERLSLPERVELRRAIVDRVPMSDDLTDADFAALAADGFRRLDEEEAATLDSAHLPLLPNRLNDQQPIHCT